jgi:hypothetical protein
MIFLPVIPAILAAGEIAEGRATLLLGASSVFGLFGIYGIWVGALGKHPISTATAVTLLAGIAAMSPVAAIGFTRAHWSGSLDNYLFSVTVYGPIAAAIWLLVKRYPWRRFAAKGGSEG